MVLHPTESHIAGHDYVAGSTEISSGTARIPKHHQARRVFGEFHNCIDFGRLYDRPGVYIIVSAGKDIASDYDISFDSALLVRHLVDHEDVRSGNCGTALEAGSVNTYSGGHIFLYRHIVPGRF